jgi:hypothetical protein
MSKTSKFTKLPAGYRIRAVGTETLEVAVSNANSVSAVLRNLGITVNSRNVSRLATRLDRQGLAVTA